MTAPATPDPRARRATWSLAAACLIALGIARFSYALVLPSMRSDLGLSYAAAGSLGTANTAGYLLGSLLLPLAMRRWPAERLFRGSVVAVVVAVAITGASRHYPFLVACRALAGFGGAGAFIIGSSFAATLVSRRANAVAVFNAGAGVGVMVAGALVPPMLSGHPERWPQAWVVLGAISAVGAAAAVSARVESPAVVVGRASLTAVLQERPSLRWLTAAYVCFGFGYIVYITFVISLLRTRGAGGDLTAAAFVVLGLCTIAGPRLWRQAMSTWPQHRIMSSTLVVQAVAAGLLIISTRPAVVIASTALFGSSFMISPATVTLTIRQTRPPETWTATLGTITALFAAAQAISPWASGALIDRFGANAGPTWTICFSLAGMACALSKR